MVIHAFVVSDFVTGGERDWRCDYFMRDREAENPHSRLEKNEAFAVEKHSSIHDRRREGKMLGAVDPEHSPFIREFYRTIGA